MVPHTVVVDFAVALLITSIISDLLAQVAEDEELRIVGSWTLLFGTLAAAFAALSGFSAASAAAPTGEAEALVLNHRNSGLVTLSCFVPLAVWRLVRRPQTLGTAYWTLALIGLTALVFTAYLGGTAVFQYGVGVQGPG